MTIPPPPAFSPHSRYRSHSDAYKRLMERRESDRSDAALERLLVRTAAEYPPVESAERYGRVIVVEWCGDNAAVSRESAPPLVEYGSGGWR